MEFFEEILKALARQPEDQKARIQYNPRERQFELWSTHPGPVGHVIEVWTYESHESGRYPAFINYLLFRGWIFTGDHSIGEQFQLMRNPCFDHGLTEKKYTTREAWEAQMKSEHRGIEWSPPPCFDSYWSPCDRKGCR